MRITKTGIAAAALSAIMALTAVHAPTKAQTKTNIIDEVAWVVGDEPIFRSDIEEQYRQARGTLYLTIAEMRKAYDLLGIRSLDSILENVLDLGLRQMVDHILAKKTEEPKEQ